MSSVFSKIEFSSNPTYSKNMMFMKMQHCWENRLQSGDAMPEEDKSIHVMITAIMLTCNLPTRIYHTFFASKCILFNDIQTVAFIIRNAFFSYLSSPKCFFLSYLSSPKIGIELGTILLRSYPNSSTFTSIGIPEHVPA